MQEGEGQHPGTYRAWMLRLWQVDTGHGMAWRASLQSVNSEERRGFEDVEQLCTYLQEYAGIERRHHRGAEGGTKLKQPGVLDVKRR